MKKGLLSAVAIAVFGLLFSSIAFAQDDKEQMVSAVNSSYVISAKAGGVNFVEGKVSIVRQDGKSGPLLKTDTIEIGDKVTTGDDGKVEILLNPGSFVRLGANTEFEFQTTDLDNLKLKLSAGSAILEVYADNEFKVTLDLPDADLELTKSGVFRIDVQPDGSGKLSVWKGKVMLGDQEVKAGKSAIIKGSTAQAVAKFDRDNKDALDIWSDLRAKEASKINKRLQRDALTNALLNSYNRGGWNMFGTFGLWVYDAFSGRWSFLPFGFGWSSPYGYGYGFNIGYCPLPPVVYNPPAQPPTTPTTPGTPTLQPERVVTRSERSQNSRTPTFQRFENNQRGETRGGGRRYDDSGSGNTSSGGGWNNSSRENRDTPNYSPSQPSPTTPSSSSSETRTAPSVESRTESKEVRKID